MTTTLTQWLATYADKLSSNAERLGRIAEHWNGFEGWLKWELVHIVRSVEGDRKPWVQTSDGRWKYGQVGVEYRYRKAPTDPLSTRSAKLVDLWVSAGDPGHPDLSFYFEIKTVFFQTNQEKQLASWRADFDALDDMMCVRGTMKEDVAGFASVLCAVGFPLPEWEEAMRDESTSVWQAAAPILPRGIGAGPEDYVTPIRLAALTRVRDPLVL